jgi:pyruvate ferredoxin oxidoreductase beta subunit
MMERGHNVTYICYDNEAYMNTGVQRSSATPLGASTMTSPAGLKSWGKEQPKKNLPTIMLAHGIPYVATASIAFPKDLTRKVKQALFIRGPKYIEVHSPCPIGWGFEAAQTIEIARLAVQTGLVPLYEAYHDQPFKVRKLSKRVPVTEYLRPQTLPHLFTGKTTQHTGSHPGYRRRQCSALWSWRVNRNLEVTQASLETAVQLAKAEKELPV